MSTVQGASQPVAVTPLEPGPEAERRAAELLARVFQRDPLMQYLVADEARMLDKPLRFYRACVRMGLLYGAVHTTPALDGLAIWISPGKTDFGFGQMLRTGMLGATLGLGLTSVRRFMAMLSPVEALKKQSIGRRPHWYLQFLAVEPARQGQGLGGRLMQPMLARADAEGTPCCLDSGSERNLAFYQRHGFRIAGHTRIPDGGPQVWAMLREPGLSASPAHQPPG